MAYIDVPGARLYYEVHGDGPTLLLSPGNGVPSSLWGPLLPLLSARFRTVVYDMRGIGRTEVDADSHPTVEEYADDLHALAAEVGRPAFSLGHAWGAWVAGVHAIRHPDEVRGLVLCSLAGWFPITPEGQADAAKVSRRLQPVDYAARYAEAYCGPDFLAAPQSEAFLRGMYEAQAASSHTRMMADALRSMDRPRYWAQWTQPTLLCFGTHDRFATPAHAFELARRYPDARLEWLYRAGHFTPIEAPERVASVVVEWALG